MARSGYLKLSNDFHSNTKVKKLRRTNPGALLIYVCALSYASDNLTDGYLSGDDLIYQLDATDEEIDALCTTGMLEPDGNDGYRIHDYLDYQNSREQVEDTAEKALERKREWRKARQSQRDNIKVTSSSRLDANVTEARQEESHVHVTQMSQRDMSVTSTMSQRGHADVTPSETHNQEPRTKNQITTPLPPPQGEVVEDSSFNDFLNAYPKHGNRDAAESAWANLIDTGLAEPAQLVESARRYAKAMKIEDKPLRFIPQPANWLTNRIWIDYQPKKRATHDATQIIPELTAPPAPEPVEADITRLIEELHVPPTDEPLFRRTCRSNNDTGPYTVRGVALAKSQWGGIDE